MKNDPYTSSTLLGKLNKRIGKNKPPRLAFMDIDSTFAGSKSNQARKMLEKLGYAIIFNTSRTEELIMSERERKKSESFIRPVPHLGKIIIKKKEAKKIIYYYVDPLLTEPRGILDPDVIIGSTGTAIWIRQTSGGYKADYDYQKTFKTDSRQWRISVNKLLVDLKKQVSFNISHLEDVKNYEKNRSDVAPPDFRFQVFLPTLAGLKEFRKKIGRLKKKYTGNIRLINDSKPDNGKFVIYLTPILASKSHAQEHVIKNISRGLKLERKKLEIFIAGDSWPDLIMGISGKSESETFLLVGGSRLYRDLTSSFNKSNGKNHHYHFSGESLKLLSKRILPTDRPGIYSYKSSRKGQIRLIMGDEKYPKTRGVDSVLAYLKEHYPPASY